jgi:hypothetical protein
LNFDRVARAMLMRALREAKIECDTALQSVLDEVLSYPGVPTDYRAIELGPNVPILIPMHFRIGSNDVHILSTVMTLGTAQDITLRELRIEMFYPADAASATVLRALAD